MKIRSSIPTVFRVVLAGCAIVCFVCISPFAASAANNGAVPFSKTDLLPILHAAVANPAAKPFPGIAPRAYLVADLDSGEILSEKNSKAKLPIASLTKLMTATIAFERVDLQKKITIQKSMLAPYGYSPNLIAGKSFSLAQLLYPVLVESSNDAAQAMSCFVGNKQMIKLMNGKARSLYMGSTNYSDAHGLSPKNTSTVRDLFYLARYISKNHPKLFEITRGNDVAGIGAAPYAGMKNKNLVYGLPDFVGGKTGYIPESNYNGLFIFNLPLADGSSRKIAIIVLGAPHLQAGNQNLKSDVVLTLDWLKKTYGAQADRLVVN